MRPRAQNRAVASAWKRWAAFLCLLVFSLATTAQAVHVHGQWLPRQEVQVHVPDALSQSGNGEEHCPLCVAIHPALPVESYRTPPAARFSVDKPADALLRAHEARWHFAMFSRPPPVLV